MDMLKFNQAGTEKLQIEDSLLGKVGKTSFG